MGDGDAHHDEVGQPLLEVQGEDRQSEQIAQRAAQDDHRKQAARGQVDEQRGQAPEHAHPHDLGPERHRRAGRWLEDKPDQEAGHARHGQNGHRPERRRGQRLLGQDLPAAEAAAQGLDAAHPQRLTVRAGEDPEPVSETEHVPAAEWPGEARQRQRARLAKVDDLYAIVGPSSEDRRDVPVDGRQAPHPVKLQGQAAGGPAPGRIAGVQKAEVMVAAHRGDQAQPKALAAAGRQVTVRTRPEALRQGDLLPPLVPEAQQPRLLEHRLGCQGRVAGVHLGPGPLTRHQQGHRPRRGAHQAHQLSAPRQRLHDLETPLGDGLVHSEHWVAEHSQGVGLPLRIGLLELGREGDPQPLAPGRERFWRLGQRHQRPVVGRVHRHGVVAELDRSRGLL